MTKGYLIDMDGVIYRGAAPIAGAAEFIRHLQKEDIPFLFLTNNSTYTPLDVVVKLRKFGINTSPEHVLTAAMVGETMESDIKGATELGFQSILVLTGSSTRKSLKEFPFLPTRMVDSIAELVPEAIAVSLQT